MSERRERVRLTFDPGTFTGRLRLMDEALRKYNLDTLRAAATWEPHDWSDFQ